MIRYKVRAILKENKKKPNGLVPIYLSVTIDGRRSYMSTSHYINKIHWDGKNEVVKSGNPFSGEINMDIQSKKSEIIKKVVGAQIDEKTITVTSLKRDLSSAATTNYFDFSDKLVEELRYMDTRKSGTLENYRKHNEKFSKFTKSKAVTFQDINAEMLQEFRMWLKNDGKSTNYSSAIFKSMRKMFNTAIQRKVIPSTLYPFSEIEFPEYKAPGKEYLTKEEIDKWEKEIPNITDAKMKQAAVYFLFGVFTGLRVSDWYQFDEKKHIVDGFLRIRPKKTGFVRMEVNKRIERVLALIRETPLKAYEQDLNEQLKLIAKRLKIRKKLTTHCARHTFAITICLGNNISSETGAELMGITLATFVNNYSQVNDEKINMETRNAWKGEWWDK
ncbi:MAG: site-specific integrase [Chitinophagaceae bacterium]